MLKGRIDLLERKAFLGVTLTLLLLFILALTFNVSTVKAGTIIVPDNYPTIQEAINAASLGDIIFVRGGTYYEHIIVNKTVQLVGEDPATTIVDGSYAGTVVTITSNNTKITGFTIQRSGWAGIEIHANNCAVIGNNITNNYNGIWLSGANSTISRNNITNNDENGIKLVYSFNNVISGNNITNNGDGVQLGCSFHNTIFGNNITNNDWTGIWLYDSFNNTMVGNSFVGDGLVAYRSYGNIVVDNLVKMANH